MKCFALFFSLDPLPSDLVKEGDSVYRLLVLKLKKLKPVNFKQRTHDHTTSPWQNWGSHPCISLICPQNLRVRS